MSFDTNKILVLGERNVGKTTYIKKMTRDSPTNNIGEIMSNELDQIGIQRAIHEGLLSSDVINFMVYYGHQLFLNSASIHIPRNMQLPAIDFEEMDYPFIDPLEYMESGTNIEGKDLTQYTKVLLMCDFIDITSIRSMLCFITTYKLSRKNTIICVNKCDHYTEYDDITMNRIYKVLQDFSLYPIEFISANTGFNLEFIYKYI